MHTGEEYFQVTWQHWLALGVLLATYLLLSFANKLPGIGAFKDFLDAINSAGGHIFLLSIFTLLSIKVSMQFIYHTMALPDDVVTKDSAVIGQGISYVTGVLTGSFLGALLKTMSGGKANGTDTLPPPRTTVIPVRSSFPPPAAPAAPGALSAAVNASPPPGGRAIIGEAGDRGTTGDLGSMNSGK